MSVRSTSARCNCREAEQADAESLRKLFDLLPDVYFFAKDVDGHFIMANRLFADLCGVDHVEHVLGKTDWDFFTSDRASLYIQDDRRVMETHTPMINRIEPSPSPQGGTSLVITSKVARLDSEGRCIGIAGIARDLSRTEASLVDCSRFERSIAHVEQHYGESLPVAELARIEGMSVSCFERNFKKAFQTTPTSYIKQIRIRHAARLLVHSNLPITEIALSCGFYDNSHFTNHFKRALGLTPIHYRQTHKIDLSS
jgi:PAS domain S-box-containing protein